MNTTLRKMAGSASIVGCLVAAGYGINERNSEEPATVQEARQIIQESRKNEEDITYFLGQVVQNEVADANGVTEEIRGLAYRALDEYLENMTYTPEEQNEATQIIREYKLESDSTKGYFLIGALSLGTLGFHLLGRRRSEYPHSLHRETGK